MRSLWVLLFVIGTLAFGMSALTGCTVTGAIYKSESLEILPLSFKGAETFCWEGLDMTIVDIKPTAWGKHECSRPLPD